MPSKKYYEIYKQNPDYIETKRQKGREYCSNEEYKLKKKEYDRIRYLKKKEQSNPECCNALVV